MRPDRRADAIPQHLDDRVRAAEGSGESIRRRCRRDGGVTDGRTERP